MHIESFAVNSIDTNGAGDTHIGAFITVLSKGAGVSDAARYANATATISTRHHGCATVPFDAETQKLLREH